METHFLKKTEEQIRTIKDIEGDLTPTSYKTQRIDKSGHQKKLSKQVAVTSYAV